MTTCPFKNGDRVEVCDLTADQEVIQHMKNGLRLTVDDSGAIQPHHPGFRCWYIWCRSGRDTESFYFCVDKHLRKVA